MIGTLYRSFRYREPSSSMLFKSNSYWKAFFSVNYKYCLSTDLTDFSQIKTIRNGIIYYLFHTKVHLGANFLQ